MIDPTTWTVLALLIAIGVRLVVRAAAVRRDQSWLPGELRQAKLAYAERMFRSKRPRLVAKVDRAYRRDGRIVLLELKTRARHRVYGSDVIELSAQKLAVEAQTREEVDAYGYVLTARPGREPTKAHRVTLMSRAEVELLMMRRERVLDGREEPRYASHPGLCRDCGFRQECRPSRARPR